MCLLDMERGGSLGGLCEHHRNEEVEEPVGEEQGVELHSECVGPEVSVESLVLLDKPVLPTHGSLALGGNSLPLTTAQRSCRRPDLLSRR